jgi:hypothetical protein
MNEVIIFNENKDNIIPYKIERWENGILWLSRDGEGMEVIESDFYNLIDEFFNKYF